MGRAALGGVRPSERLGSSPVGLAAMRLAPPYSREKETEMRRTAATIGMVDSSNRRRVRGVILGMAFLLAASSPWAQGQESRPDAGAIAKVSLARYVPRQDLFSYLEFEGLDAHLATWRASAAYKVLNETKLGPLWEDLAGQMIELAQQSVPPDRRVKAAEGVDMVKHVAHQGFAFGVWGKDLDRPGIVAVLRRGDRPEIRRWLEASLPPGPRPAGANPTQNAGRTLHPLDQQTVWRVEKGDLVLSNRPDAVLSVL